MTLRHLNFLRRFALWMAIQFYRRVFGLDLADTVKFSMSAKFDLTNPKGVHVGECSYIAFGAVILTHDMTRGVRRHTRVGRNCFIGARSMLMPGVTIGDGSIVGAYALVNQDVPPGCMVAGNPARIVRRDIKVGPYGRLVDADERQAREAALHGFEH